MKNSLIKVLSFVMALTMIVGCFAAISFSAAECNHTKGAKGETVAPTCVDPGFTWYTCATCGEKYMDDIVAATGEHTVVEDPATPATCTSPAMTAGKKCSVKNCGKVIEEKKPVAGSKALGHDFQIKETPASCTDANVSYYECTRCNKTATKASDDENLTGDARYDVKYPSTTHGAAIGHDWDYVVETAPTTCVDGKAVVTCKNCKTVKNVVIPAVHKYVTISAVACGEYVSGQKCELCGTIKDGKKNEDVKHTWENVTAMNATVEAMGYKTAAELYKAPNCTDAGYQVQRCKVCNAYATNEIKATGHNLTWGTVQGGEKNKDANLCVTAKTKTATCSNPDCKYTETIEVKAAVQHKYKTVVLAPTCTTGGYTEVICENAGCKYSSKSSYKDATGHVWGAWEYTGDCTSGIVGTRKCTVEGCNGVDTTTIAATSHNMTTGSVVKEVAATCQAKAYYVYYCQNAHCQHTEKVAGSDFGEKNTANHQDLTKSFTKTAATCTSTGVDVYLCKCGATIEKTTDMIDHVEGTSYSKNGTVVVNVADVAPNCQADGRKGGKCCTKCGKILKQPEVVSKSTLDLSLAASHKDTDPDNHGNYVEATCISEGYQLAYFSCCGYVKINVTPATNEHTMLTTPFKAPTCTEAGNHKYTGCSVEGCGYVANVNPDTCPGNCGLDHDIIVATVNSVIPALGHDLEDVEVVNETCTVDGTTAHKDCSRCDYTEGKRVIPAHGSKYKVKVDAVAATCTTDGKIAVAAGTLCTVCNADQIKVPALGHAYATTTVNDPDADNYDCTKPTYVIHECTRCGASYADQFVAGKAAHNYELSWHKVENKDGVVVEGNKVLGKACQVGTYEYRKCVNCDQDVKQNEKAPISHYMMVDGTTKVEFKLNCGNIADFDGHTCALCGAKVVADASKAGEADLTVSHNVKKTTKDATCTEAGYSIEACADCGMVFSKTTTPAIEHAVKYVIEIVEATNAADGYKKYMCANCNTEVTEKIAAYTGLVLDIKAEDKAVAYANGQIKVTVALTANKYAFNSIHFQFAINNDQIKLAETDAVKVDYAFAALDAVTAVASDNGEYVDVLVYVPNGADGKAKNVSVTGNKTAFVTLTFDVLATANGDVAIPAVIIDEVWNPTTNTYDEVEVDCAILTEDVAYLDANGKIAKKNNVEVNVTELKTTVVGNVNGDTQLDAGDSIAIQTAIYKGEYLAGADFDKNGKVDLADHVAFVKFVTSKQSVVDYLAAMNITIDGVIADMNLKYDIDGDRAAGTDNDKAVLATYITSELSQISYLVWSADLVEVIEEVAFLLASGRMPS